jgi:hypothetical protein
MISAMPGCTQACPDHVTPFRRNAKAVTRNRHSSDYGIQASSLSHNGTCAPTLGRNSLVSSDIVDDNAYYNNTTGIYGKTALLPYIACILPPYSAQRGP